MIAELLSSNFFNAGHALVSLSKSASTHPISYALVGRLVLSSRGWLVLTVPADLIRGAFSALHEPGSVLADVMAIPVMTPQEIDQIGEKKITERGKQYHYSVGGVRSYEPGREFSKITYLRILSPELKKLRLSYGLSAYPKGECFQLPLATRAVGVLGYNELSKVAECLKPVDELVFDIDALD